MNRRVGRYGEFNGFMVDGLMRRVGNDDGYLVFPGGQPDQDHRLAAGFSPVPGRVIHHYVNMADTRSDFQRVGSKYRFNAQVFDAVLNKDRTFTQRSRQRWVDDQFCWRLGFFLRRYGGRAINILSSPVH